MTPISSPSTTSTSYLNWLPTSFPNISFQLSFTTYLSRLFNSLNPFHSRHQPNQQFRLIQLGAFPSFQNCTVQQAVKLKREWNNRNPFIGNKVTNTKYSVWTFLFLFGWEQFGRFMNFYFLMIACLQLIKQLTPINPITTWTPLIIIFSISAIKEIRDDYNRYKADLQFNEREYIQLLNDGSETLIKSGDIRVGDIIKIKNEEEVPCDLVILKSNQRAGEAFVSTSNLDGETNLKSLSANNFTKDWSILELSSISGNLEIPNPNQFFYQFEGRMIIDGMISSLNSNNLLLQGTLLKNTEFIYGIAVYTGNQTKLGLNKGQSKLKLTILDLQIERASIFIFFIQLLIVLFFGSYGNQLMLNEFSKRHYYLNLNQNDNLFNFFERIKIPLRMLLLLSLVIPISLKVSMDVCKFICSLFISWDLDLFDERRGPTIVSNTSIPDELGQIEYLFTDKTGTLTENQMIFKCCGIMGKDFAYNTNSNLQLETHVNQIFKKLGESQPKLEPFHFNCWKYFEVLNLCHKVQVENKDNEIKYLSTSPDEETLINMTNKLGFHFLGYENNIGTIQLGNLPPFRYQLLDILEFTSERKCMSVIVRRIEPFCTEDEPILILTKGADDNLIPKCKNSNIIESTLELLDGYANLGYRTLAIAYKSINLETYKQWKTQHLKALNAIEDRDQKLELSYQLIERDLELLGCTGIEDKLQPKVNTTISNLRSAGIKIWMLTGDKLKTALQIGKSCHLIDGNTLILDSNELDPDSLLERFQSELVERMNQEQFLKQNSTLLNNTNNESSLNAEENNENPSAFQFEDNNNNDNNIIKLNPIPPISIIIDGQCLKWVLESPSLSKAFLQVALGASSVVCCRCTPSQKGQVVQLIRQRGLVTLAIGDGGNDVMMIQTANVGVGLRGKEGLQASRAADVSLTRFHHLRKLILVHGRYGLSRVRFTALYCFYKSIAVSVLQAGYQFVCGFSGASLLTTYSLSLYNVLYTGLPILFYSLDKDIPEVDLLKFPELYKFTPGRDPRYLFVAGTFKWFGYALIQGSIALTLSLLFYSLPVGFGISEFLANSNAFDAPHTGLSLSFMAYSIIVIAVQLTLAIATNHFTILNLIVVFGTILTYFITTYLVSVGLPILKMYEIAGLFWQLKFWLVLILCLLVILLPFWLSLYWAYNEPGNDPSKKRRLSSVLESRSRRTSLQPELGVQDHSLTNDEDLSSDSIQPLLSRRWSNSGLPLDPWYEE